MLVVHSPAISAKVSAMKKEELVFEDDEPCERYMSWRNEIGGDE